MCVLIPSSHQILLPPPPLSKKWNIGTTDMVFISEFSLFHENYRLSSHCIIVIENYKHYFIIAHPSKITGNKEKSCKQRKTSMTSLLPVCSSPFGCDKSRQHAAHVTTAAHAHSRVAQSLRYCNLEIVTDVICISCHANQQNEFSAERKALNPPPTILLLGGVYQFTNSIRAFV